MQSNSTRVPYFPANLDDYAPWVAEFGLYAPYGECQCGCGKPAGTVDHIVPVTNGGTNDWDNLTSACSSCNSRKHDRSLLTFLVKLYDE